MKGLTRNKGETVTEADGIEGIDWRTGAPLTGKDWCGGPYVLVNDYVFETPEDDFMDMEAPMIICESPEEIDIAAVMEMIDSSAPVIADEYEDVIIVDGVKYRKC